MHPFLLSAQSGILSEFFLLGKPHYSILAMRMAAAPVYGNLQACESESELFSSYLEQVQLFFAENMPDDKKAAVFLNVVGRKTYSL